MGTQPILFGTSFVCKAIEFHGVSLRIIGGRSEAVHRRGEVTNGGFRYRIWAMFKECAAANADN